MKKTLYSLIVSTLLMGCMPVLRAQQTASRVDKLRAQLQPLSAADAQTAAQRAKLLCELGDAYLSAQLDSSEACYTRALVDGKSQSLTDVQALAHLGLGNVGLRRMAQSKQPKTLLPATETHIAEALALLEPSLPETAAPTARLPLAQAYCAQAERLNTYYNKPAEAQPFAEKAMSIADQTDDNATRIRAYWVAGDCAAKLPERKEYSLGYNLKALQLARATQDSTLIVAAYSRVADEYVARKDYSTADKYLEEAQQVLSALQNKIELAPVYLKQGLVYLEENKPQKAIDRLTKVVSLAQNKVEASNIETMLASYALLERAALAVGDTANAEKYRLQAEALRKQREASAKEQE